MTALLLGRICRTCLLESDEMFKLLDRKRKSIQVEEMLNQTVANLDLWLGINEDIALPVEICGECLEKLNISYDFKKMCLINNERLRNFFKQNLIKNEDICALKDSNETNSKSGEIHCSLQEDFKIEYIDDIQVSLAPCENGIRDVESFKDTFLPIAKCPAESNVEDKLLHQPEEVFMEENKDSASGNNLLTSDPVDTYRLSDYKENTSESDLSNKHPVPNIRLKRKYVRRAPLKSGNKTCPHCAREFKKRVYLTRHLPVHSLDNKFICDICEYRYPSTKLLTIHKSRKHCDVIINVEGGPYPCPDCPMIFEQTRALAAHRVKHLQRDFNCEICGADLKTLGAITRHMNCKHPGVLPYKCKMCDKAFPVKTHYEVHLQMHEGYKKYKCEMCDKSFPNTTALKDHVRTHTGESPYLCSHCGKSFKTTNILRQHIKRHGERSAQCPKCPARFFGSANLRQHMFTHSKVKAHVCDICGSAFTRSDSLKAHKFKHSGQRPFKCEQCNLSFVFKAYLTRHMIRHTGEKPHSCTYCDRAYASSGDLVKHLRTHVGENTYFCDICPQTFRYQHDLRDHKNDHYNEKREAANQEAVGQEES